MFGSTQKDDPAFSIDVFQEMKLTMLHFVEKKLVRSDTFLSTVNY